jgi:hypothetical protein
LRPAYLRADCYVRELDYKKQNGKIIINLFFAGKNKIVIYPYIYGFKKLNIIYLSVYLLPEFFRLVEYDFF